MRHLLVVIFAVLFVHGAFADLDVANLEAGYQYTPNYQQHEFVPPAGYLDPQDAYNAYVQQAENLMRDDPFAPYMRFISEKNMFELTDPLHRKDLEAYYKVWKDETDRSIPFYNWLDIAPDLPDQPLDSINQIHYMSEEEKGEHEVVVREGKIVYFQTGEPVDTPESPLSSLYNPLATASKWIFVLGGNRQLYITRKNKGTIQHSSLGGYVPVIAAGSLSVTNGKINGVAPTSGHYHPKTENIDLFLGWLSRQGVETGSIVRVPFKTENNKKFKEWVRRCQERVRHWKRTTEGEVEALKRRTWDERMAAWFAHSENVPSRSAGK
ncbi:hypothetical protein HK102_003082 [Quaeritorhiza haematococci]|nr:hypothetical protein HK102_003082 [Quaeritorhiza haematococci]